MARKAEGLANLEFSLEPRRSIVDQTGGVGTGCLIREGVWLVTGAFAPFLAIGFNISDTQTEKNVAASAMTGTSPVHGMSLAASLIAIGAAQCHRLKKPPKAVWARQNETALQLGSWGQETLRPVYLYQHDVDAMSIELMATAQKM